MEAQVRPPALVNTVGTTSDLLLLASLVRVNTISSPPPNRNLLVCVLNLIVTISVPHLFLSMHHSDNDLASCIESQEWIFVKQSFQDKIKRKTCMSAKTKPTESTKQGGFCFYWIGKNTTIPLSHNNQCVVTLLHDFAGRKKSVMPRWRPRVLQWIFSLDKKKGCWGYLKIKCF